MLIVMLDDRINGLVLPEADQIGSSKQANSTALLSGDHFVELMDYITWANLHAFGESAPVEAI
jgi:hypothetical protein